MKKGQTLVEVFADAPDPSVREERRFLALVDSYITHMNDFTVMHTSDIKALPWRANVRTPDGTLHWQRCRTLKDARAWIARWRYQGG